jgi:hypothetical protein
MRETDIHNNEREGGTKRDTQTFQLMIDTQRNKEGEKDDWQTERDILY